MAPKQKRASRLERPDGGSKRKIAVPELPAASVLLLLDILDHLGHIVLILAELGGILKEFLVLLFGFFERNRLLFLIHDVGLLGLELGIELLCSNGLKLLLNRRDGTGTTRFQKRLRVIGRATFRADHGFAQQIVVPDSAARTNSLGAPFGFGHHSLHRGFAKSVRRAIATTALPCQKQTDDELSKGSGAEHRIWADGDPTTTGLPTDRALADGPQSLAQIARASDRSAASHASLRQDTRPRR